MTETKIPVKQLPNYNKLSKDEKKELRNMAKVTQSGGGIWSSLLDLIGLGTYAEEPLNTETIDVTPIVEANVEQVVEEVTPIVDEKVEQVVEEVTPIVDEKVEQVVEEVTPIVEEKTEQVAGGNITVLEQLESMLVKQQSELDTVMKQNGGKSKQNRRKNRLKHLPKRKVSKKTRRLNRKSK